MNALIETCFDNIDETGICVVGTGKYMDEFLSTYCHDYKIAGVYSDSKIGESILGFNIKELDSASKEYAKYIICDEDYEKYLSILKQKNIDNIGVYSNTYIYPGRQKYMPGKNGLKKYQAYNKEIIIENNKIYNIGYIAGVFDMFHIGHLNLIKRAKSMCNYLIVGVVSDRGVIEKKKTKLIIPFDERIELIRACKYVDEAVEIPFEYCQTTHAFRKYHFDVQFSGSDYENSEGWKGMREYLRKNGSDMIFFPYTKSRSTTSIKESLSKERE